MINEAMKTITYSHRVAASLSSMHTEEVSDQDYGAIVSAAIADDWDLFNHAESAYWLRASSDLSEWSNHKYCEKAVR